MTIVCITGMHRSGTSMIAHLLKECGLYLGPDEKLIEPAPDNPDGFWENIDFLEINDQILSEFGGGWDLVPEFPANWGSSNRLSAQRQSAQALLRQFSRYEVWGWKDSRNSITLPFWKQSIPELKVVIIVRNPVSVADSLKRRGVSSYSFSMHLWLNYYLHLIESASSQDCIITHYDSYFANPTEELQRVMNFIGIQVTDETINHASSIIKSNLRNSKAGLIDLFLQPHTPLDVIEKYIELCVKSGPILRTIMDQELSGVDFSDINNLKLTDVRILQIKLLQKSLREKNHVLQALAAQVAEKEQAVQVLTAQVAEKEQAVQALTAQLTSIYTSRSWRITALVRALAAKLRQMKERVRVIRNKRAIIKELASALPPSPSGNTSAIDLSVSDSLLVSAEKGKMKIAAVTMVYNEALLLPYFLRHYRYLDEIHVLYETDSIDESLEILKQAPNVVIEYCHIQGGLDDIEKIKLINEAVQRMKADWVYVVDPDEFIFPPNDESPHDFLKRQSFDVVQSGMYQVYRHRSDRDLDPSLDPIPQRIHGDLDLYSTAMEANRAPNNTYVKPNIVRPSKKIQLLPGHHQVEGELQISPELYIGAHWQMADPSIAIARRMQRRARISERNRVHRMGWQHFDITVNKIKEECERRYSAEALSSLAGQYFITTNANSENGSTFNITLIALISFTHPFSRSAAPET